MTPAAILTIISFGAAAIFGVVGLHHEYRDPVTKKVTSGGKISLLGIVLSTVFGILSTVAKDQEEAKDRQDSANQIAQLNTLANQSVRSANQIVTNLQGGSLRFSMKIPCEGPFDRFCRSVLEVFHPPYELHTAYRANPGSYTRLPFSVPRRVYVRVADDPMPNCPSICNPGGILSMNAETDPREWSMEVHTGLDSQGQLQPAYLTVVAEGRHAYVSSYGTEMPSLESLRGRIISVVVDSSAYGVYVDGITLMTNNGQEVGVGRRSLRTRRQTSGSVAEFRFPSDRDPRTFQDDIYYQ
jgi:hypothetical protein